MNQHSVLLDLTDKSKAKLDDNNEYAKGSPKFNNE